MTTTSLLSSCVSGSLSPEDALTHPGRHWITRAIGPREAPAAQIAQAQLRPGDALLLASDGLDVLSAGRIHETMTAQTSAKEAADGLVALGAPQRGDRQRHGRRPATRAILWRCGPTMSAPPTISPRLPS